MNLSDLEIKKQRAEQESEGKKKWSSLSTGLVSG